MRGQRNRAAVDREISAIATDQDGIISTEQLRDSGLTAQGASYRAGMSRLHRIHRGVYAVGHEAIGDRGRLLAAALACGPGSLVSHLSAAALWGLRKPTPAVIELIVPCQTGRKIDGIRARRCRYPTPGEMTALDAVPCTTSSRTLVDLAGMLGWKSLRRAVEQAAVLRLLDIAALDLAIAQAKGRRGLKSLQAAVVPWRGGGGRPPKLRSVFEARLFPALAEAGLPLPRCNVRLLVDGNPFEADLLWEEQRLVIEADGEETHGTRTAFQQDRWRDQVLTAAGYRVARVTWLQIEREPAQVVARIRRMLGADRPAPSRVVP